MNGRPNIVLVHGAWADGSCWSGVIERLQAEGFQVRAPQFPLTSLADDVARLRQVLEFQDGPTIVVGHSYGGQIITALGTDAPNVVGLVYIAAFGLDEGESLGALLSQGPGHAGARASLHRLARLRLALRGRLRQPLRRRRRADARTSPVRRAAGTRVLRVHRRDGRAGVEVAAVLVPRRAERRGDPAGRRAAVRSADGRDHGRDPVEPRRDGLPSRRGRRPDREGRRSSRRRQLSANDRSTAVAQHTPTASTQRVAADNAIEYAYRDLGDERRAARPAAALPRQPRQLGPRAHRRARRRSARDHVRQRRRRRHDRQDAEHGRGDGPRCDRLPRGNEPRAGRSARLLDRQLRRAGDRAHPPRPAAARRARVLGTAGCGGDARLGAGGDRRGRRAGDEPAGIHLDVFFAPTDTSREAGRQAAGRIFGQGPPTATSRRRGRPARRSTTPSARGASPTTRCFSESPRSSSRCSSPTATATR